MVELRISPGTPANAINTGQLCPLWLFPPQGPATAFLKFSLIFSSAVSSPVRGGPAVTQLGQHSFGQQAQGALEQPVCGMEARVDAPHGALKRAAALGPSVYPACPLPWRAGHQLAGGHFPGMSLPSVPFPSAATSQSEEFGPVAAETAVGLQHPSRDELCADSNGCH